MSLGQKLKRMREIRDLKKSLESEEKALRDEIMPEFGNNTFLAAGDMIATLKERMNSRVDSDGIKLFMGEKYNEYVTKSASQVLEVEFAVKVKSA